MPPPFLHAACLLYTHRGCAHWWRQAGHDKEISILFDHFDTDHSGTLGPDEVRGFLTALGICPPGPDGDTAAATIMRELDRDGGGDVSRDEFVKWAHAHLNHGAEKMSAEEVNDSAWYTKHKRAAPTGRGGAGQGGLFVGGVKCRHSSTRGVT